MADVRALLKAKRQEVRITHPYATYGASGALRCTACGATVKFASAWEGHLGSKAHRVAVANLKAKEATSSKRRVDEEEEEDEDEEEVDKDEGGDKDERMEVVESASLASIPSHPHLSSASHRPFPADFFSDPSRAPSTRQGDDDDDDDDDMDEDEGEGEDGKEGEKKKKTEGRGSAGAGAGSVPPPPKSQFDMEWAAFEREMQNVDRSTEVTGSEAATDPQETYTRATIIAEPELVPKFEGLPVQTGEGVDGAVLPERERKVSEEEERRRKQEEERELIMDRLLEEERAQEEADSRVAALKSRVEMLKRKREFALKAKGKNAQART